jgi:hypothetical protein
MDTQRILTALDNEIEKLTYVRALVTNTGFGPKRRTLSAAARKRIGDAQRKRWAKAKKKNKLTGKT